MKANTSPADEAIIGPRLLTCRFGRENDECNASSKPAQPEISFNTRRFYNTFNVQRHLAPDPARVSRSSYADVAPRDRRSVNRANHGFGLQFPLHVTVAPRPLETIGDKCLLGRLEELLDLSLRASARKAV